MVSVHGHEGEGGLCCPFHTALDHRFRSGDYPLPLASPEKVMSMGGNSSLSLALSFPPPLSPSFFLSSEKAPEALSPSEPPSQTHQVSFMWFPQPNGTPSCPQPAMPSLDSSQWLSLAWASHPDLDVFHFSPVSHPSFSI